jgi:ElaA protein
MINWSLQAFNDLTPLQLEAIFALRAQVFVVEQNCVYNDVDGKDKYAFHLMGHIDGRLAAYARLLPINISYNNYCSIGRVVTHADFRGRQLGQQLMLEAIKQCKLLFGEDPIKIGAQFYLLKFYENLGFSPIGKTYLEDGIAHIEMCYKI